MPCCLLALAALFPRVALVIMWLVGYGRLAFDTAIWPVLGFFFMPFTTCAYAFAMNEFGGAQGLGLALIILGVIFDIGSFGGGGRHYQRVYYYRRD